MQYKDEILDDWSIINDGRCINEPHSHRRKWWQWRLDKTSRLAVVVFFSWNHGRWGHRNPGEEKSRVEVNSGNGDEAKWKHAWGMIQPALGCMLARRRHHAQESGWQSRRGEQGPNTHYEFKLYGGTLQLAADGDLAGLQILILNCFRWWTWLREIYVFVLV